MNSIEIMERDKKYYMPVFARYPLVLSHGCGSYVYDLDGKKYLDFLAGIAVNILGHAHPKLVDAIHKQAGKIIHCSNLYYTEPQSKLVESLAELCGFERIFLTNSGAEANEGALKLARKYGKTLHKEKTEIITAENSFHGRTLATLTATGQPKYRDGYEPLPAGFRYVNFNDINSLEKTISDKTCAVMLEPIQGEGGINMPAHGYLKAVRELCDKYDSLLIFDEIQTGVARTGNFLASQGFDVKADIVTLAKGLGGGMPIGAFMSSDKIAQAFKLGDHGTTFGGNPLASATANAVLSVIEEEGIIDNARKMGDYTKKGLTEIMDKYPDLIVDVRGTGLMVGIELTCPGNVFADACLREGVIINCTAGNVLRLVPALNITEHHVDEVLAVIGKVMADYMSSK